MPEEQLKKIVKALQEELPVSTQPFRAIAERCGMSEKELLEKIRQLKEQGIIRRFGARVRHQRLGMTANGMGVWQVPEKDIQRIGKIMASFPEVSHCYQRPTYPDWPYNMFTMIHARTREECRRVAERIKKATGLQDYELLFSKREFKKSTMRYF